MSIQMLDREQFNQLLRYCKALCNNSQQADDLFQSTVSKALANPPVSPANISWFRRVAKNIYIDQYRHEQRFPQQEYDDESPINTDTNELEAIMISADELDFLWQRISLEERELLFLWAVEGYTAAELADQLDVPRGTILARLHRTKQRLRSIAEEQCA